MMMGYKTRKKRLRGTTSSVTAQRAATPSPKGDGLSGSHFRGTGVLRSQNRVLTEGALIPLSLFPE